MHLNQHVAQVLGKQSKELEILGQEEIPHEHRYEPDRPLHQLLRQQGLLYYLL